MSKNNARMIDEELFIQAGIDRKTGLPLKYTAGFQSGLQSGMKHFLRLIDEQDAVNRFKWTLPKEFGLTGQEIERHLYYKGQLCFFKLENKYYLMPYALEGFIDFYGRFNTVHPVPFASGMEYDENEKDKQSADDRNYQNQQITLSQLKLKVIYNKYEKPEKPDECCVILYDYSKQMSQNIVARYLVNEPLLNTMACMIPYLNTCAIASTGIKGVRVADADQYEQVNIAGRDLQRHALNGKIWYPIIGSIEMQELTDKSGTKMQEYMQTLQSLDNLRLSGYGLENGGLFEKKAHMLGEEQEMNNANTGLVLQDALEIRKHFCETVKNVFGVDISVEVNQTNNEMNIDDGTEFNEENKGDKQDADTQI